MGREGAVRGSLVVLGVLARASFREPHLWRYSHFETQLPGRQRAGLAVLPLCNSKRVRLSAVRSQRKAAVRLITARIPFMALRDLSSPETAVFDYPRADYTARLPGYKLFISLVNSTSGLRGRVRVDLLTVW